MEIIGEINCGAQYRFVGEGEYIDKKLLLEMGIHSEIEKQLCFQKFEAPKDTDEDLVFENGRIAVNSETYVISTLEIGNVGLSTSVWGTSDIATDVLDRVVKLVSRASPVSQLEKQRKRVTHTTRMKVRLDIEPRRAFSEKFTALMDDLSRTMVVGELSKVETHFPTIGAIFVSEPEVAKIISRFPDSRELESELKAASGVRGVGIMSGSPKTYRDKEFEVLIHVHCDKAKEILTKIEEILR